MKKVISIVLSLVLVSTMLLVAIPVMATTSSSDPIVATPLTDYQLVRYWGEKVTHTNLSPNATKGFTTAKGISMTSVGNAKLEYDSAGSSEILAAANYTQTYEEAYELPENFADNGSFIIYVKTDSANEMVLSVTSEVPSLDWFTTGYLANNTYEYLPIGGDKWITDNAINNVISFNADFEGYIKVSVKSLSSDPSLHLARLGQIAARFKYLGSEYGEVIAGPFFVTTSNSDSTKITVPAEYQPAPILATPLTGYTTTLPNDWMVTTNPILPDATKSITKEKGLKLSSPNGGESITSSSGQILVNSDYNETMDTAYALPEGFKESGSFIIYVKTETDNELYFSLRTECPSLWFTTGELSTNAAYEYLENGEDEWISDNASGNIIKFNNAFDGYIKIPVSSLVSLDGVPLNLTRLSKLILRFAKVGGTYGDIIAGPFFVTTSDSASTKITVPTEYQPKPLDIKTVGFNSHRAINGGVSVEKQADNNYKLSVANDGCVENDANEVANRHETALILDTPVKIYMKDAEGVVFYVNLPKANVFVPALHFDVPSISEYDPAFMLKPDTKVYLLPKNGAEEWVEKTVEQGSQESSSNDKMFGKLTFEEAFEGYIKVPFASMGSDTITPVFTGDNITALTQAAFRFRGIGGDYGDVVAGVTGYYTEDTARPEIGTVALPKYPDNDLNFDWKFDANDLSDIRSTLLGKGTFTGREVTIVDLFAAKKDFTPVA